MSVLLHAKSHYSLGDGCAAVGDLVDRAARYGHTALALTDVENMYGQVRFHHAARAHGITPLTGVELRGGYSAVDGGRIQGRLILLARDRRGYESLCRIVTMRRCTGFDVSIDPLRCLDAFPSGLFYLSDDPEVLRRLLGESVPADDVRLLVADPAMPMIPGIRGVPDPDVAMLDEEDADLRLLLLAIRRRCKLADLSRDEAPGAPVPGALELHRRFESRPDLIDESAALADACTLDLTQTPPALPTGEYPDQASAHDALVERCRERLGSADAGRVERFAREVEVLRGLGFAGYFLVVAEITDEARARGIAMAARGSVAGSLVAHLLGITAIDPVANGLFFERFLHAQQSDLPDIELDIASDRRDELVDWIFRRFGEGHVAMVSAHPTFGRRAAFREGLKAFGMDVAGIDRFIQAFTGSELEGDATVSLPMNLLPARFHGAVPLIERLVGAVRHATVDPGAVVIAESRVDHHAPLERSAKGIPVTQYDTASLGRLGLVKLDLSGNRALAARVEAMRLLGQSVVMPDGDPDTVAGLRAGNAVGCFRIETPVIRGMLRNLPVRGISDLMAALAIVRPGPAAGEAMTEFVRRANGEAAREPVHPRLAERLRENYGMLLYDEDLMAAISALTGWPVGVAEEMRCAMLDAAPGSPARMALKRRFLVASSHSGVPRGDGERVWQLLERFAAYSVCKAHASSHALIAWESAFLKTHHPVEFACAVLNNYDGHYPLRAIASDFTRCGVRLLAPHVNHSGAGHQVEDGGVRLGLAAVKFLTARNRDWILKDRPFPDLRTMLARVPLSPAELESLMLSGACDDLAPLAASAYPFPHEELLTRWKREPGLRGLDGFVPRTARGGFADTHRTRTRIRNELRFLGMHPSEHPIRVLRGEAAGEGCTTTAELAGRSRQFVRLAVVVIASRRHTGRNGEVVQFVTLEDEYGLVEGFFSPSVVTHLQDSLTGAGPLLVSGWMERDGSSSRLKVSEVKPFPLRPAPPRGAEAVWSASAAKG